MAKYNKIYEGRLPSLIQKDAIEIKHIQSDFNIKNFLSHLLLRVQVNVSTLFKR